MENFYSYKNKMPENDQNLGWNVANLDLSSVSLQDENLTNVDSANTENISVNSIDEIAGGWEWENSLANIDNINIDELSIEGTDSTQKTIDESVFLESWNENVRVNVLKDNDNFWAYLRWFFFSAILTLLSILAAAIFYSFSTYITEASKPTPDSNYQEYITKYKEKYKKIKGRIMKESETYEAPTIWSEGETDMVNKIINATDIDYIEKKDLLSKYAIDLVNNAESNAVYLETLKQDIAKQWFLPEELEILLSDDQAIDTIQRSLNALEVIKFSTATKVFSYMNTALSTISEMIKISWSSVDNLRDLFNQISARWEKDISSYVYMCYLNPFEINANCDVVGELDLHYKKIKDSSININLLKNAMNVISQLLEKEDTTLFSITFNGFNAEDKNITFNIEVYTNQEDERSLMEQWKKNPNIFILTNIVNLLKQSSFIIWAEINTKEVNVDTKTISQWGVSRTVNYSTMDFTVPIQKNTEREIFDYIDIDSMNRLLSDRWLNYDIEPEENEEIDENNGEINENDELLAENNEENIENELSSQDNSLQEEWMQEYENLNEENSTNNTEDVESNNDTNLNKIN